MVLLTNSPQLSWECHYRGWLQPAVAAQGVAAAGTAAELSAIGAAAGSLAATGTVAVGNMTAGNMVAAAGAATTVGIGAAGAAAAAGPGAGWPAGATDVESPVSQVELLPDSLAWEEWDMQVGVWMRAFAACVLTGGGERVHWMVGMHGAATALCLRLGCSLTAWRRRNGTCRWASRCVQVQLVVWLGEAKRCTGRHAR